MPSTRTTLYRSRSLGLRWAAEHMQAEATRDLFRQIAMQWDRLAMQLEILESRGILESRDPDTEDRRPVPP